MSENDTYLSRFLDLVVSQTEKLERSFKKFEGEVTTKIDALTQRTTVLENRVGSLEGKVEEVLKKVSVNGSGSAAVVDVSKQLEERLQKLETTSAINNGRRNPIVIWGKQFYFPSWMIYVFITLVSIVIGAAIATGNVTAIFDFIRDLIKGK